VKEILRQYAGKIDVVEMCTDDLAQVAEEAGVVSIPTIQFYFKGEALESHSIVGCVAKTVLANAVDKVLEDAAQLHQQKK
jgi:thioredoxin 1